MEIRVLKYFLMVAREESITKAASRLHITQPTLSRQMADLEADMGAPLLDRSGRKIALTPEGILLRRRAEEIVSLVDKTEMEVSQAAKIWKAPSAWQEGISRRHVILCVSLRNSRTLHPLILRYYTDITYILNVWIMAA